MPADENKVKQRIELDGEKEYKKALDDAYRTLRVLKSELKAETAELGKNATAQEKNAVKMKSLQKQIAEQEKIVKTYKDTLEEVRKKYSDNQEEIAKWEQKLNNARTTLANMKNDLEGVGDGFKAMQTDANMATVASKSAADAIGSLADIGGSISDSIEGIFTGMLTTVKGAISDIWADVVDLAARSNNLVDLAGFWNTDVTTIQKYAGAVEAASAHLEDLSAIVTKINAGDMKKITELTGVSGANYKDQWEYAMAVMDAMSKMSKEERNAAGFEIFGGRQATKAFDLLNDWQTVLDNLDKFDATKGGYGLAEEELQNMSTLYDKINAVKASWQSLQDMATVKLFGSLSLDLTSNAQGILDGFLAYFNADSDQEREEAIGQIEENITAMFTRVKQAIQDGIALVDKIAEDMKASEDPTVQTIGKLMGGLADALEWFTEDNMSHVVTALEILAAFWIAGKGLQMAGTIAELAANIRTLSFFKLIGGSAGGLGAIGETVGTSAGTSFLAVLKTNLPGILAGALVGLPVVDALLHPEKYDKRTEAEKALEGMNGTPLEQVENLLQKPDQAKDALHALFGDRPKKEETPPPEEELPRVYVDTTGEIIPLKKTPQGNVTGYDVTDEQMAAVEAFWDVLREKGADFTDEEWDAYEKAFQGQEELFDKIDDMMNHLIQTEDNWRGIEDLPADWWLHGANQGEGITNENLSAFNSLPNKMEKAVARAVSGIRVSIDGRTAGQILAPYVSESIASNIS